MTLASTHLAFWISGFDWAVGHPAWSVAILSAAVLSLGGLFRGFKFKARREYGWALAAASAAILLMYAYVAVEYCLTPQFHDHVEPQVAAVSCLLLRGQPIYLPPDAADQYSMIYGPYTYLCVAGYYRLTDPSLLAAKLSGVISGAAGVLLLLAALKRIAGWWIALPCAALATTLYLQFDLSSLWCRPDSHETLLVSLGIFALTLSNPWMAAGLLGISAGVITNLKLTALIYFFPIFVAQYLRHPRLGPLVLIVVLAAIVAAAPFLLPQFSLLNYLAWLREASRHAWRGEIQGIAQTVGWLAGLLLLLGFGPVWSNRSAHPRAVREWWLIAAALGAAIVLTLPFAGRTMAGPHHLMPLAPVVAWMLARAWSIGDRSDAQREASRLSARHLFIFPIAVVSTICVGWECYNLVHDMRVATPFNNALVADLLDIVKVFPDRTIEMGVGGNISYGYTYARPVLVFAGNPYHLDISAAMDSALDQNGLPRATTGLCRSGLADLVLIPTHDNPFVILNWYHGAGPVFSNQFRQAFFDNYQRRFHSRFFDIYERKSLPDPRKAPNSR